MLPLTRLRFRHVLDSPPGTDPVAGAPGPAVCVSARAQICDLCDFSDLRDPGSGPERHSIAPNARGHHHRGPERWHQGLAGDAQPSPRHRSGQSRGALLQPGRKLPKGLGLVPCPDAPDLAWAGDRGEDAGLLHSSFGSGQNVVSEPCGEASPDRPRSSRETGVGLHASSTQPAPAEQALPASGGAAPAPRANQPQLQGPPEEPVPPTPGQMAGAVPQEADPHRGRRSPDPGPLPGASESREVLRTSTPDNSGQLLLQHHQRLLLPAF